MRHDFTPDLAVWEGPALNSKSLETSFKWTLFQKELKLKTNFKHINIKNNDKVPVYLNPNH